MTQSGSRRLRRRAFAFTEPHSDLYHCSLTAAMPPGNSSFIHHDCIHGQIDPFPTSIVETGPYRTASSGLISARFQPLLQPRSTCVRFE